MLTAKIRINITIFNLKIIISTAVKNHCVLHGPVLVMFCMAQMRHKVGPTTIKVNALPLELSVLVLCSVLCLHE